MTLFNILIKVIFTLILVRYGTNFFDTFHCESFEEWMKADPTLEPKPKPPKDKLETIAKVACWTMVVVVLILVVITDTDIK